MVPEISEIRSVGPGCRRRRVYLDGCEWRSVPAEVVRDLGLRVGQSQDAGLLEARIVESEPTQAWERALRLLNYRERGSGELRKRLLDDGYEPQVVEDVLARALDLGFIDDRRFAEGLARGLTTGKRQGRRRVAAGLAAKGVDESLSAEVLDACCDEEAEHLRALALAARLAERGSDPARIAKRLVMKGFSTSLAWAVAREVTEGRHSPPDEG
jgi:regulatory protein